MFERSGFLTASGAVVFIDDPWSSQVCLGDIALSLARQCRFGGHIQPRHEHYSVAQHSVLVSHLCTSRHALVGLLHDATEAFVQDLIRPMKRQLHESIHAKLEHEWALRLGAYFGVGDQLATLPHDVMAADQTALATEMRDVYFGFVEHETRGFYADATVIVPIPAFPAYRLFRERVLELEPELGREMAVL